LRPKSVEEIQVKAVAFLRLGMHQEAFEFCREVLSSPAFSLHDGFDSYKRTKSCIKKLPPLQFTANKKWVANRTIMFAGDEVYIDKFFKHALDSLQETNHGVNVHLHAMLSPNTDPKSFHNLLKNNVSFSHEVYSPEDKTGYTSRRFVRMFQLLEHLNHPILCLDIDSKVVGKLDSFFDAFSDNDIGIYRRDLEININQLIHAGMFYASPTKPALRFLGFFINYIQHLEETKTLKWFADQMALLAADQWSLRASGVVNVKRIPEELMSWSTPTSETLVITYKGSQKHLLEN
jgi:hypothetical protein